MVPPCVRAKGTLDTRGVLHDGPHGKVARAPLRRGTAGCSAHLEQGAWRGGGRRRRATPLNSHCAVAWRAGMWHAARVTRMTGGA